MREQQASSLTLQQSIEDYLRKLRRRGRSPETIKTYRWGLRSLERFAAAAGVQLVAELDKEVLERWQDSLDQLAPKSRQLAHTAVREWLRVLLDDDLVHWRLIRAVEVVRAPRRRPRPIPQKDLQTVIEYLRQPSRRSERQLRDRALFGVLLSSAARISEALSLRRDQIQLEDLVVIQKGGTEKALMISPTALSWVREYLGARRDSLPQLWVSSGEPRRPLTQHGMRSIWELLSEQAGVRPWTSHQLRHTGATELKRAGIPDLVIADHLGHSNLATLADYAAVVDEHRQQKLEVVEGLLRGPDGISPRRFVRIRGDRDLKKIRRRLTP